MQQELFTEKIEVGSKYELDGVVYLCHEILESGIGWFQKLDAEGNPIFKQGVRVEIMPDRVIIWKRKSELKLVK